MSLKAFHVLFITVSVLLSLGVGAWALREVQVGGGGRTELWLGVGSLGMAVALLIYGRYFLRKLKNVSYL